MASPARAMMALLLLLSTAAVFTAQQHDYDDALRKSILFFEGQRSGRLPPGQRVRWWRDSALNDAFRDHSCWERPEDMDTPRTVYKVDTAHPGSDVAAETAAALAAASIVFREADPAYSTACITWRSMACAAARRPSA
ncbi:hypothetical protein QYE76_044703 [Lolium multiflorum]|uniref:cellulase n=1 Tax=Lolium multiflorum TaxID=4521 RepID=A0AAD8TJ40_LOLMU|nr:hypothetical protein QYE76_044703 [Lolium multiflorum]